MRNILKRIAGIVLVPLTKWYLRKERKFQYQNLKISVLPGIFHPGFFNSTKFLLQFLNDVSLKGKTFLELGCGSGTISVFAAKREAIVTASDISFNAIYNTALNARGNNIPLRCIHSDVFDNIHEQFDFIIVNPPYYPSDPKSDSEFAWYCGVGHEYFKKFFSTLSKCIHEQTHVYMVLSQACDLKTIEALANQNNFLMTVVQEQRAFFEGKDVIFKIETSPV